MTNRSQVSQINNRGLLCECIATLTFLSFEWDEKSKEGEIVRQAKGLLEGLLAQKGGPECVKDWGNAK